MDGVKNLGRFFYKQILRVFAGSGLRKIGFIEKTNIFIRTRLKPEFIVTKKYKHKMYLDPLDSLYLSVHKDWEDFEMHLMENEIKKGDTVLDLGANIGTYTLVLAKLVGDEGRVYSFEADPKNFEILKKNVEVNGYKNIKIYNKAALDKNGAINLYVYEGNTAGNSLYSGKSTKCVEVDAIKLDDFLESQKVDFVKLDIEGSEFKAAQGMSNLLKNNQNIKVLSEFYPKMINGVGNSEEDAENYLKFLRDLGFSVLDIDEKSQSLNSMSDKAIIEKCGIQWTNLFCKR